MRKLFFASLLSMVVACGAGESEQTNSDTAGSTTVGNSAGSDIVGMDTMRMDTSLRSISPK